MIIVDNTKKHIPNTNALPFINAKNQAASFLFSVSKLVLKRATANVIKLA